VCGHCGSYLVGITHEGRRQYVCGGYLRFGRSYCTRNTIREKAITDLLLHKLQQTFLEPEHLAALRAEVRARESQRKGDNNRARLKALVADLARKIDQGNENLATLPRDRLPGVVGKVREFERERLAALAELAALDKASEVKDLEERIAAAEAALWRLQEAVREEDTPLLRQLFQEMVSRIVLHWTTREAGKVTRCDLVGGEIYLRTSAEPSELSPSAGRSRCSANREPRAHRGHLLPG
jgi:hypothetical protein